VRPIILTIIASFLIPVSADAVLVGRNIISNSSFENRPGGKDEDPPGWDSWNSDLNGIVTDESRSGSQAAYLLCPKNSSKEPMEGKVSGQISIEWIKKGKDEDGKDIFTEIKRDWGPEFGPELSIIKWAPFKVAATAPDDSDICRFVIQFFNKGGGSGKFFVDDVSGEEIDRYFKKKRRVVPPVFKR
jgi:hypothetical protein